MNTEWLEDFGVGDKLNDWQAAKDANIKAVLGL